MSKLELDDQILNHPKFIRAVKLGGAEAVFLWLGIRAYCGQLLTDGFVPADMLDEVRGPLNAKKRAAALQVLVEVRLLDPCDGGFRMHDFLQWSRSKSQVLADRERARERQARSRGLSHRDGGRDAPDPSGRVTIASASASATTSSSATTTPPAPTAAGASPEAQDPDPGRETVCPLNLLEKLEANGTVASLAEKLATPVEAVREEIRLFVAYWTIGKGMGQKRTGWAGRARQRVVEQHARPGGLEAPGAIEHRRRGGKRAVMAVAEPEGRKFLPFRADPEPGGISLAEAMKDTEFAKRVEAFTK